MSGKYFQCYKIDFRTSMGLICIQASRGGVVNEPQPPPPQTLPVAGERLLWVEFVAGFGTPVWPTNHPSPPPPPLPPTTTTSSLFIRDKNLALSI